MVLSYLKGLLSRKSKDALLEDQLAELKQRVPVPVFWLLGKTQSGKTSIVRYLTRADDAEIGAGFRPTTRFSRCYQFPTPQAPLLSFLDTRGLGEPGYDPDVDIAQFNEQAHIVIVTARAMDHAQESLIGPLRAVRNANRRRPVVLALTCLHEAYPQQQHSQPYPFATDVETEVVPENLQRSLAEHRHRFRDLVDIVVPIDLTKPEEGFAVPDYGGDQLKGAIISRLPAAYRQTLLNVDAITHELRDWHQQRALPYILGYSTLAGTAGAIPIPWLDLLLLPGIQTRMIYHVAQLYGQPLTGRRFLELATALGLGLLVRQALREVVKFIPGVGSLVGSVLAGSSTFALGKAFCYYYSAVLAGHVPDAEDLRSVYEQELKQAEKIWQGQQKKTE
jgi:uncharacterized protein (DUF697 family)/predicted GTPase